MDMSDKQQLGIFIVVVFGGVFKFFKLLQQLSFEIRHFWLKTLQIQSKLKLQGIIFQYYFCTVELH